MSIPDPYIGRTVKCTSCARQFVARTLSQIEEEQIRQQEADAQRRRIETLTAVNDFLAAAESQHYLDLDAESRDTMESVVEALLADGPASWRELESSIVKQAFGIRGRTEFLTVMHRKRVENLLEHSIAATTELQRTVVEAASLIATRFEGIRIGTSVSGAVAARALGQQLADDFRQ
jgi:hypothetical protein